jgi:hypothetical protein
MRSRPLVVESVTLCSCQSSFVGVDVVARRAGRRTRLADFLPGPMQRQRTPYRLGSLHPRLDVQVTHQDWIRPLQRVVQRVMQPAPHSALLPPAIRAHGVKHRRELATRLAQCLRLLRRWTQQNADCALHSIYSTVYTVFSQSRHGPALPCRLKAVSPRPCWCRTIFSEGLLWQLPRAKAFV